MSSCCFQCKSLFLYSYKTDPLTFCQLAYAFLIYIFLKNEYCLTVNVLYLSYGF